MDRGRSIPRPMGACCLIGGVSESRPTRCPAVAPGRVGDGLVAVPDAARCPGSGRTARRQLLGVASDSLGARRMRDIAYSVATRTGVQSLLVEDRDIVAARRILWAQHRIVAE